MPAVVGFRLKGRLALRRFRDLLGLAIEGSPAVTTLFMTAHELTGRAAGRDAAGDGPRAEVPAAGRQLSGSPNPGAPGVAGRRLMAWAAAERAAGGVVLARRPGGWGG